MAKDPAFLFYPGDWLGGTMGMSFETQGCYLNLIILQFNMKGRFTEAHAQQVLGTCFAHAWPLLKLKFETDGTNYWNIRLLQEMEKRSNFSNSRRKNALGKSISSAHAEHMENENINEIDIRIKNFRLEVCAENLKRETGKQLNEVEVDKFCNYWTEYNKGGKKFKAEMQKVFNIKARLTTWYGNTLNAWNNGQKKQGNNATAQLDRSQKFGKW